MGLVEYSYEELLEQAREERRLASRLINAIYWYYCQRMAKTAVAFCNSPEGQTAIEEALAKARKVTAEIEKARRIDPKKLHDPMTI